MIKSSDFGFLWDGDDGGAFEAWGDFAQLQWSVEDLCEDGGQLVSTGFKAGWWHTFWYFPSFALSEDLAHVIFTDFQCSVGERGLLEVLMVVWRGVLGGCVVFFQTYSKIH